MDLAIALLVEQPVYEELGLWGQFSVVSQITPPVLSPLTPTSFVMLGKLLLDSGFFICKMDLITVPILCFFKGSME